MMPPLLRPKLKTFVANTSELEVALASGYNALVLEDAKTSIRSFSPDFQVPGFDKFKTLARLAREKSPNIELSASCDFLVHHNRFSLVDDFLEAVQDARIPTVRIQDIGLIKYIHTHAPSLKIDLLWETGNHNTLGMCTYDHDVATQHLSNELPHETLLRARQNMRHQIEIQVQGPILIQYSHRRYMAGFFYHSEKTLSEDDIPPLYRLAEDHDYPNRKFPFSDTVHGHFMYAYFDRCLIRYIPDLMSCQLDYWVIDARGESLDYLKTAGQVYAQERDAFLDHPATYTPSVSAFDAIQAVAKRPQKAGFFRANKTDQVRPKPHLNPPQNHIYLGKVLDVIKGKQLTVELDAPDDLNPGTYLCVTPEGKELDFSPTIMAQHTPTLFTLDWSKGISVKTRLYRKSN